MSYWILTITGQVISQTIVRRITNLELSTDKVKSKCSDYDQQVVEHMRDENHVIIEEGGLQLQDQNEFPVEDDPHFIAEFQNIVSDPEIPEEDESFTPDTFDDTYLNMKIALPRGGGDPKDVQFAKVTKHLRDVEGRPIGMTNDNPLLDTQEYEVEFSDGHVESMSASSIAQHLFSQVDEEGHQHILLDDIIDFQKDGTVVDKADHLQ